jgi:hypothetical protein
MSVADASQEDLIRKQNACERWVGTTHCPNAKHTGSNVAKRDGMEDPYNRSKPVEKPGMDERTFQLTGIRYIQSVSA